MTIAAASRRLLARLRRRPFRSAALGFVAAFALLNVLAYRHAGAMLRFVDGGRRTARPQSLTVGRKVGVLLSGVRVPRPENDRTPADAGLPFETHKIALGPAARLELWSIAAERPCGVVAMFHGYAESKSTLLDEAAAFHDLGYEVVLADFRGSGGSTGRDTTIGYREADDVAAVAGFVRSRKPGLPLVLYGRSMGAAAVLRGIAVHDVRAGGVILESVFDRLVTTVGNRFRLMGVPAFPAAELLVFWGGVRSGFSGFGHDPVEYATACRVPVLMLHGEADPNARLADAEAVKKNLPSGTVLEVFPHVGHEAIYAADSERWRRAVRTYLESNLRLGASQAADCAAGSIEVSP